MWKSPRISQQQHVQLPPLNFSPFRQAKGFLNLKDPKSSRILKYLKRSWRKTNEEDESENLKGSTKGEQQQASPFCKAFN